MARHHRKRDLQRIRATVSNHHRFVYRLAFRILRNAADAEDVTQTVFLKLVRSPRSIDTVSSERAWLARVTVNCALSLVRSEDRRRKREETWRTRHATSNNGKNGDPNGDSMNTNEAINDAAINDAIASLPEDLRVPLVLHYQEGFKYREIAEACGCPEGTVAQRISRARARLKERLHHSGALAAVPALDAALRADPGIDCPPGLEQSLLSTVEAEFATLAAASSLGAAVAAAIPKAAVVAKVGAALVIASAFFGTGWIAMDRLATSTGESSLARGRVDPDDASRGGARGLGEPHRYSHPARSRVATAAGRIAPVDGERDTGAAGMLMPTDLTAAPATISGRVVDSAGRPVAGARVALTHDDVDSVIQSVETDEDGRYRFDETHGLRVALGQWHSQVESVSFIRDGQVLAAGGDGTVKYWDVASGFELQQPGGGAMTEVAIEFIDISFAAQTEVAAREAEEYEYARAEELAARQRAHVEAMAAEAMAADLATVEEQVSHAELRLTTTADAEEARAEWKRRVALDLTGLPPVGRVDYSNSVRSYASLLDVNRRVVVEADGFETAVSDQFQLSGGDTADGDVIELDFELRDARGISGAVFSETGHPIPGATVTVAAHTGDARLPASSRRVETDDEGRFTFPSLAAKTYVLVARAPGFLAAEQIATGGGRAVFQLPLAGKLTAMVVDGVSGEPLRGYSVQVRGVEDDVVATAVSDEDGVATFDPLRPGDYRVTCFKQDSRSQLPRAQTWVFVRPGEDLDVELGVAPRVPVHGVVVPPEGESLPAASVVSAALDDGIHRDAERHKTVAVGADGSFRVGSVVPGHYILALRDARGHVLSIIEFDVFAGEPRVDVQVPIMRDAGTPVEVIASGSDGVPLASAVVEITHPVLGVVVARGKTGEKGRANLEALAGNLEVAVRAAGHVVFERDLVVDSRRPVVLDAALERETRAPESTVSIARAIRTDTRLVISEGISLGLFLELLSTLAGASIEASRDAAELAGTVVGPGSGTLSDHLEQVIGDKRLALRSAPDGVLSVERR